METYVTFNNTGLQKQVNQLQSPAAHELLSNTLADMFDDSDDVSLTQQGPEIEGMDDMDLSELSEAPAEEPKKAPFNRKPVPMTKVPANPCTDPMQGAPGPDVKRAAKCTLKKSPRCYKLQARFLQIQGGIADSRDDLMDQISKLDATCKETAKTLEAAIAGDQALLESSNTKMAG